MADRGTGPRSRLSVEASGLSPATNHSSIPSFLPGDTLSPGTAVTRLTISSPGRDGCATTTRSPRSMLRLRTASAQSPGRSVGQVIGPASGEAATFSQTPLQQMTVQLTTVPSAKQT